MYLQFWETFNCLQGPQNSQHSQGLDGADVFSFGPSTRVKHETMISHRTIKHTVQYMLWLYRMIHTYPHKTCENVNKHDVMFSSVKMSTMGR